MLPTSPDADALSPDASNAPNVPYATDRCSRCGAEFDVSELSPLTEVSCPQCGVTVKVLEHFQHFLLLSSLGRGGMGTVFRAFDRSLERDVALKLLRRELSGNPEFVAQLEIEAALTASIVDPHVVRVFSTGSDKGLCYISMELITGGTLAHAMDRRGKFPEVAGLNLAIQIAEGLRAAFRAGLVHRDVKPANVLFVDAQTVKVADFGLAVPVSQAVDLDADIWGTPYYIAPEKLERTGEDVRSDIYSFGGTLFHMLAGRPPFEAKTATEVALKQINTPAMNIRTFAPEISNATAYILQKCLQKQPEQRYAGYDELLEELHYAREEASAGPRTVQPQVSVPKPEEKRARGWVPIAAAALIVFLALVGGFFAFGGKSTSYTVPNSAVSGANAPAATADPEFVAAMELLAAGDPDRALKAFTALRQRSGISPIAAGWAILGQGLSELVASHLAEARESFILLAQQRTLGAEPEALKLARFFADVGNLGADAVAVPLSALPTFDRQSHENVGLLIAGLKTLQLGRTTEAAVILREFRTAASIHKAPWIKRLGVLATSTIAECAAFDTAKQGLETATTPEQRTGALLALLRTKEPFVRAATELAQNARAWSHGFGQPLLSIPARTVCRIVDVATGNALRVVAPHRFTNGTPEIHPVTGSHDEEWVMQNTTKGVRFWSAYTSQGLIIAGDAQEKGSPALLPFQVGLDDPVNYWKIELRANGTAIIRDLQDVPLKCPGSKTPSEWKLVVTIPDSAPGTQAAVPNGIYFLRGAGGLVAQAGRHHGTHGETNANSHWGGTNQEWIITALPGGTYRLETLNRSDFLTASNDAGATEAVMLYSSERPGRQEWVIDSSGDTSYKIQAKGTGRYLTIVPAKEGDSELILVEKSDVAGQRWALEPVGVLTKEK